ncbi:SAM hydrolase/SAM-dependent halogenase family protein [Azospirillum halopraeferens]|uniref:SAM hydrolase/SAM-dependent halogenase family protein n=1 Tax=Azospirillum halopraeferens TaxID=34010 RepID=UPI000425F7AB|nr:SAM-dependent chlorinase/fluorinase [Azospirillum halopraeferens]
MIVLFTDFGPAGPYVGQMKAVLAQGAPGVPVIDLLADAPAFDPQLSGCLLAAYAPEFPAGAVFLCVVDPGVGTDRPALVAEVDGRRFVGPDNGLFALIVRRAAAVRAWRIDWRPRRLSASFHGRDLFAPVAARLATGGEPGVAVAATPLDPAAVDRPDWPDDPPRVAYVDVYGNAVTGVRAGTLPADAALLAGGRRVLRGRTFADVPPGEALWYENSSGLAEIAVNRGRADRALGLAVGDGIGIAP